VATRHHPQVGPKGINRAETIGERLRRLRLERDLSQRDLSGPGVSYAYISRIEAGARRPSVKALRKLAEKLGVTAEYLETGSEIGPAEARELKLADLELQLRLDGDASTAELQELLEESVAQADEASAARAHIALGVAADARGKHAEAIEHLERATSFSFVTATSRPEVHLALAHSYAATGSPSRAIELLEQSLAELKELAPEDTATRVRFSTYLSYALTDLGELTRARAVVSEALFAADEGTDPYTRVRLYWSLGRISGEQANSRAALESFRRAIALLETTDDTLHLARAHMACAEMAMIASDGGDAAAHHLTSAERLLGPRAAGDDLAVLRRVQATASVRSHEYEDAERYGQQALEFAAELPNEAGLAWCAIAEARAGAGDPTADDAFRQAIDILHAHGTVRDYANVLRIYGRYLRDVDRQHDAMEIFERAANVASNLQGELSTAERENL
jgi:transcriptional regulator with XRE-family HTH domain